MKKTELPKGWKWVKLGEVCDKMSNGANVKQFDEKIGFPISRIETIWNETIDLKRVKYIYENDPGFIEKYSIRKNDILFSHINSDVHLGKTAIYKGQAKTLIHGINLLLIRLNQEVVPDFFNYQLKCKRRNGEFISIAQKSVNQSSINQSKLKNIDFVLPPKSIQLAIVSKIEELFSEIDNGIESLRTAQHQLKTYRQSVLKWAFEGKLTSSGLNSQTNRDRSDLNDVPDPHDLSIAAESAAEYKVKMNHRNNMDHDNQSSDKGELPEGWKWVKLGEVCRNVEYGSATKSKKEGRIPVLRMGNIQNGVFDWSDLVYTDDEKEIDKYLLNKDDVLFNRTNSAEWVGKTSIYKGERPAIFAGYLIRINRIENLLDANYLTYYLNSLDARKYGNQVRSFGVNQSNINGTKLKSYPIPLAPITEQKEIVEAIESRFSVANKTEESIAESLQQAEALKQSILKKAFEGNLG